MGDFKHVRLHRWLLESSAYRSLGPEARCLLVELYNVYNGANNGEVFLSVRDAGKRVGVCKDTASKAFAELEERGFIRARQRGCFQWKTRKATEWVLTEFEYSNQLPTKDFMRWQASEIQKPVPHDSHSVRQNGTVAAE